MPDIDIVDSTWIGLPPSAVAPLLARPVNWRRWWPELDLLVTEARGEKGMRWSVRAARGPVGPAFGTRRALLVGAMEIWLQPVGEDGQIAHYFLQLDAAGTPLTARQRARLTQRHRARAKQVMWSVADDLDPARLARVASRHAHAVGRTGPFGEAPAELPDPPWTGAPPVLR